MKQQRGPRIGPLNTVQSVRRELGRVYRLARLGEIEVEQLRAFTYSLKILAELVENAELEERLDVLETRGDRVLAPDFPRRAA